MRAQASENSAAATLGAVSTGPALWRFGDAIAPLRALVKRGGVLAVPTESSYALAVDPRSEVGVAAIYRIKTRDASKPLPVAGADVAALEGLGLDAADPAFTWARGHWPATLTAVVPFEEGARGLPASAGCGALAVRVPGDPRLRRLLTALAVPLTVTSANRSGEPPILDPASLGALLGEEDAGIVDGGALLGGPPSTLVRWHEDSLVVLRAGAFPVTCLAPDGEGR